MIQENQFLGEEVRTAQETSDCLQNQISKLNSELNDYKNRVSVNNQESETYKSKIPEAHGRELLDGRRSQDCARKPQAVHNTLAKVNNELKITCNELEDAKKKIQ